MHRITLAHIKKSRDTNFNCFVDAIMSTDTNGNVRMVDPVVEKPTGCKLSEADGQPFNKIFHVIDESIRKKVRSPWEKFLKQGGVLFLENKAILIS